MIKFLDDYNYIPDDVRCSLMMLLEKERLPMTREEILDGAFAICENALRRIADSKYGDVYAYKEIARNALKKAHEEICKLKEEHMGGSR